MTDVWVILETPKRTLENIHVPDRIVEICTDERSAICKGFDYLNGFVGDCELPSNYTIKKYTLDDIKKTINELYSIIYEEIVNETNMGSNRKK